MTASCVDRCTYDTYLYCRTETIDFFLRILLLFVNLSPYVIRGGGQPQSKKVELWSGFLVGGANQQLVLLV